MKSKSQQIFSKHAHHYVSSPTHASGYSLGRLLDLLQPQPDWLCLDIATGGGHVALASARAGMRVIASDLTYPMLQAARTYITENHKASLRYVQHDAEALPFPNAAFDVLTCRIAPHHFSNIRAFIEEGARVLKPSGCFGIVDIISSGQPKVARYTNLFETLRDPAHVWAFSLDEWTLFLEQAGFAILHIEQFGVQHDVGIWAERVGCDQQTIERLRTMLLQAPNPIREWYQLTAKPGLSPYRDIAFSIQQALIVAQRNG